MKLRYALAAVALLAGLAIASPAQAGTGNQFCGTPTACLNAWNGGPFVNVYTHTGAVNNDFTLIQDPDNGTYFSFEFTGSGKWAGMCIGDAYNNKNNPYTSLDPCPAVGVNAGWGTRFTFTDCSGGAEFKDRYWGGWLYPPTVANGDAWFMDGTSPYCFKFYGPA